jgi:Fe-S oxidoreductase
LEGRSGYTERFIDITYNCLLCGLCDVACKVCRYNMEPLLAMKELRARLVTDGQVLPQHSAVIKSLRESGNLLLQPEAHRGDWAQGLDYKDLTVDRSEIVFHAGCKVNYEPEARKVAVGAVSLLNKCGLDFGILGASESCCGGRAYDIGFRQDFIRCAKKNVELWKKAGVKTIITSCADCYHSFKRLYPDFGTQFEVLHTVEFIEKMIRENKLKFRRRIPLKVTYHDPCHLGRQGEPYVSWHGQEKKIRGQIVVYEPRRPRYNGAWGVYDPPRNVLKSIPGVELVEMERIREYAWCCGAGGGVKEAYPRFSDWTAGERISEARSTGAEAIVSACPWCESSFSNSIKNSGQAMLVFDVIDLVQQAI